MKIKRNAKVAELNREYDRLFWIDVKSDGNPPWMESKNPDMYFKASAWYVFFVSLLVLLIFPFSG